MVVVPTDTVVTNPVLITVAIVGAALVHGLLVAAVPEPVS
jgi:hypothetical protein